ncbi:hypothetical protein, partial [Tenacibaculum maritimum]
RKKITIKNLDSLENLDFNDLDVKFISKVTSTIKCINFNEVDIEKSYIEISNSLNNEYVSFNLDSTGKLPLNISIHKFGVEFEVDNNQSIFEMENSNKIKINYLKKWFTTTIVNRLKKSDNSLVYTEFYNKRDRKDILYKSQSLFNFLYFNNYEEYEYESWI